MKQISVAFFIIALILGRAFAKSQNVNDIFNEIVELAGIGTWDAGDKTEELLEKLSKIKTKEASIALIDLMDYYLGDDPDEELMEIIIQRGKKVIPLLKQKMLKPIKCKPKKSKYPNCIDIKIRNKDIKAYIRLINSDEHKKK